MTENTLEAAKARFTDGAFSDALRLAVSAAPHAKHQIDDRECLICECIQYKGDLEDALRRAHAGLERTLTADQTARYWQVIGRTALDQLRLDDAVDALRKALRAAVKGSDLLTLASIQQLWLIAVGGRLEAGLSTAVRDAYHAAVRSGDARALAGFHVRVARLEAQRGAFAQSLHHLSLAKSLLDRSPNTALLALYHVNRAAVLSLTGSYDAARRSGELGANLAEQAGHLRLAMAAASSVAYIATSAGDVSVAEFWLRKARKAAAKIEINEVGLLDTVASLALIQGDFETASLYLGKMRSVFDAHELPTTNSTDALSRFTELYLAKRQGQRADHARVLVALRAASTASKDLHLDLLVTLAEAESLFDDSTYSEARLKLAGCLQRSHDHVVYLAEVNRILARSLWIDGHEISAKRKLLRACSSAFVRGTRMDWAEVLREVRSIGTVESWESAYSLADQVKLADTKFEQLTTDSRPTWFQGVRHPVRRVRDPLDGFDDAVAVLSINEDSELRGREALASAIALDICEAAALIARGDSGVRVIASHHWSKTNFDKALKEDTAIVRMIVGKVDTKSIELILKPRTDVRSLSAISGIRRLLDAAKAIESQQKDQQRLSSLWQPEIIVEEPDAVFSSPQMIELMQTARKVAATTLPVLLMGHTGTGKEVLARAIHRASPRANKVFLPFNCSAVPRDMVESQLFGYRRGSFTGAHVDFQGIIRSAEGGTLFLDEIGELSMDVQPKLLRFLETNEVHPLGEGRPIKVDVRIIAATNADLDDLIQLKEFREDLYYRLNIVRFQMPELCERREEIPPLAMHLLRRFEMDEKKQGIRFSDEMMEYLLLYKWPGNVRQLSNELRRMVAMVGSNETLTPDHLSPAIRATRRTIAVDPDAPAPEAEAQAETSDAINFTLRLDQQLPQAVEALERAMIQHAMARADGRLEEAARLLGISRKGLFLKRRRWTAGGDGPSKNT